MKTYREYFLKLIEKWGLYRADGFIYLYGCSTETVMLLDILESYGVNVHAIIDSDYRKENSFWCEKKVILPNSIKKTARKSICILWSMHKEKMKETLLSVGCNRIFEIDIKRDSEQFLNIRLKYLEEAYSLYEEFKEKYPNSIMLLAPRASGDIYIALSYIFEWKEKYRIYKDVCLAGTDKNIQTIANLYGIKQFEIIKDNQKRKLILLSAFNDDNIEIKLLSPWELNVHNTIFPNDEIRFVFLDKFRYETFGLDRGAKGKYPVFQEVVKRNREVIIAPYAYSSPAPNLDVSFWEEIVERLRKEKILVYTIGYGSNEPAIKGTKLIRFSYKEAEKVLGQCKAFISVRSGLCDIVHNIKCNQIILFSNKKNPLATYFYGMKNNYWDFEGLEINCDKYSSERIINMIIEKVNE